MSFKEFSSSLGVPAKAKPEAKIDKTPAAEPSPTTATKTSPSATVRRFGDRKPRATE